MVRPAPEAAVVPEAAAVPEAAVAWWQWRLKGDREAKKMFVGADCGLCNHTAEFEYGQKGLN